MRRFLVLILLLGLSLACRLGADATSTPAPSATPVPPGAVAPTAAPTSTVAAVKFDPARVGSSDKDVTYCTVGGVALKMDVYYPEVLSAPGPLVMYVHGGGWEAGDKREVTAFRDIASMQRKGFLVATVNYRLAPEYKFPAQIEDVKCAVRYFRAHAAEYNLDPDKIGVWGGSAGGHLVSLLGVTDSSAGWDVGEYLDQSSRVQAVVDMFGPADLTHIFAGAGIQIQRDVFGASGNDDPILAAASPVTYISPDDPPFLILQGDMDQLVPLEQSQAFFDKLQAAGVPSELIIVHNAGHAFSQAGAQPISPSLPQLNKAVLVFFAEHFK